MIRKTLITGVGVFRGRPKKTRKSTLPTQTAHSQPIAPGSWAVERTHSRGEARGLDIARSPAVISGAAAAHSPLGHHGSAQYLLKPGKGMFPQQGLFGARAHSGHADPGKAKVPQEGPRNPEPAGVEGRELPSTLSLRRGPAPRVTGRKKIPVTKELSLVPSVRG